MQIDLREYVTSNYILTSDQLDALLRVSRALHLTVEPVHGTKDKYSLTPGSMVGALEIADVSILIKPKVEIKRLFTLALYAMGNLELREDVFDFDEHEPLPDLLALALNQAARNAFALGLLRGYQTEEEALQTVRGRIRFDEQIRRRYGIPLPIELRFDVYTEDILVNRLVKASVARLSRMKLVSTEARRGLGWIFSILEKVSLLEFPPKCVPEVNFDRLNEHYRHVVGLARIILKYSGFESNRGYVRGSGFLIDMNKLFQEFVTQALRESLGVSNNILRDDKNIDRITLARHGKVKIEPDLSLWEGGKPTFVGDAKYKDLTDRRARNADLFQLLAYATALDLPGGLLIYAQGGARIYKYEVWHVDKRLVVAALDLSKPLDQILQRVKLIGRSIEELRGEAQRKQPRVAI